MPASNERIQNKGLSGEELSKIIQNRVAEILSKDGMFVARIAYQRVKFEVRVTLHLDNPVYPTHISVVQPPAYSDQDVEKNPSLTAIELGGLPLTDPLTAEAVVVSAEVTETIASPNAARIEHKMPLHQLVKDAEKGAFIEKEVKYTGDQPDQEALGNIVEVKDTSAEEASRLGTSQGKKGGKR